jgi:hypothetical protein
MTFRLNPERIAEAGRIIDPLFFASLRFVCEPVSADLEHDPRRWKHQSGESCDQTMS